MDGPLCITKDFIFQIANCDGGDSCCTPDNKCGEGEGDCDSNDDCFPGLYCGHNNCSGVTFENGDDCCYIRT